MSAHPSRPATPDILERVKTIVRRDLKLGSDIAITPEMPFFGTDADVDSLDVLLLLTSIEREFGFKVPNEKVGREVFENVGTLVGYIEQQSSGGSVLAPAPQTTDLTRHLECLPHREPFRFVSRIVEVKPGESAVGAWSVTGAEAFFAGHFPGRPIVPGVLIAEALAQLSGLTAPPMTEGRLAHADVRFEQPVVPPSDIELTSRLVRSMGQLRQFDVTASVGGSIVARGSITLSCTPGANETGGR